MAKLDVKFVGSLVRGRDWTLLDPQYFCEGLAVDIGTKGQKLAGEFGVQVGTPEGVLNHLETLQSAQTQATLIVSDWSLSSIEAAVRSITARCDFGEWLLSVQELQNFFAYEYQDYNERKDKNFVIPFIHRFDSADIHLPSWFPREDDNFSIRVEVHVATKSNHEIKIFYVDVATPKGIRATQRGFVLSERATLMVAGYHWPSLKEKIGSILDKCAGQDWKAVCMKIQRHFILK